MAIHSVVLKFNDTTFLFISAKFLLSYRFYDKSKTILVLLTNSFDRDK